MDCFIMNTLNNSCRFERSDKIQCLNNPRFARNDFRNSLCNDERLSSQESICCLLSSRGRPTESLWRSILNIIKFRKMKNVDRYFSIEKGFAIKPYSLNKIQIKTVLFNSGSLRLARNHSGKSIHKTASWNGEKQKNIF